jgi:DeoR family fructose operon transcriptional repressor
MGFFDAATCAYLKEISVDAAFLSAEGADIDAGFTVPDMNDAECKRILAKKAACITVLADSSKIGKKSLVRYSDFDSVDRFITDNKCDVLALEKMYKRKAEIIAA